MYSYVKSSMFHGWYELQWWSVTFPSRVTGSIKVHRVQTKKYQENMVLSFPLNTQGRWDSEMHKQVANDELHSF